MCIRDRYEVAQAPNDLAGAQSFLAGTFDSVGHALARYVFPREQALASHQIIADCAQGLVEFMRERRGHLAKGGEARDMYQFALQLLQARLGLLPFRKVAHKAGEIATLGKCHLADRELHRKGGSVLALANDDAPDADDASFTGCLLYTSRCV